MKKTLLIQPKLFGAVPGIFRERDSFVNSFDQIFDEMLRTQFPEVVQEMGANPVGKAAYPKVNVISTQEAIFIEAELAGFNKENIELDIKEGVLTISGKTSAHNDHKEHVYVIRELKRSSFSRAFILSKDLNTTKIDAAFENGLLTITIPRFAKEESNPIKVTIK